MMDDSKKRFQIGFIGSLGFHLFVFLVLAFAGLFAANHVDDKIVEIAVFGGGGGGGGGGGSGMKPVDATEADLAAAKANALQNKQHSASQPQQQIKKSGQINTDDIIEKTTRQEQVYQQQQNNQVNENVSEELQTQSKNIAGADVKENTGSGGGYGTGQGSGYGSGSGSGSGTRIHSSELNNEDIGRWLWFRSGIVNELLKHRGFLLEWYTAETGSIHSASGYRTHFGINNSDLITVYAHDIAKLPSWEQHVWAAYNIVPEGKVSAELLASQVRTQPASTHAVEDLLFKVMRKLERDFHQKLDVDLFSYDINDIELSQQISRFISTDRASLLRLAKELVRIFTDRLNVKALRNISNHKDKEKLGSNKLLQDIVAQETGDDNAYKIFGVIIGVYDMRLGDAHPTSSKIGDALNLAGIDENKSFLRQGEQLISNFGQAIWHIGQSIFRKSE